IYNASSWLAVAGLRPGSRRDGVGALVMGGFPPLDGPYGPMLQVTMATHEMAVANAASPPPSRATAAPASEEPSGEPAGEPDWSQVEMSLTEAQTRQFVTLYQALQGFDDRAAPDPIGKAH